MSVILKKYSKFEKLFAVFQIIICCTASIQFFKACASYLSLGLACCSGQQRSCTNQVVTSQNHSTCTIFFFVRDCRWQFDTNGPAQLGVSCSLGVSWARNYSLRFKILSPFLNISLFKNFTTNQMTQSVLTLEVNTKLSHLF